MTATLASNVTTRDLVDSLRDPESYVCGVLRNMHAWARQQGKEGFVTIGVTGRGVSPHYFIGHTWISDDCELFVSAYARIALRLVRNLGHSATAL